MRDMEIELQIARPSWVPTKYLIDCHCHLGAGPTVAVLAEDIHTPRDWGDDRAQCRPHLAYGSQQGIRAGEAARGRPLPYAALAPGHPDGLLGAWQRV